LNKNQFFRMGMTMDGNSISPAHVFRHDSHVFEPHLGINLHVKVTPGRVRNSRRSPSLAAG